MDDTVRFSTYGIADKVFIGVLGYLYYPNFIIIFWDVFLPSNRCLRRLFCQCCNVHTHLLSQSIFIMACLKQIHRVILTLSGDLPHTQTHTWCCPPASGTWGGKANSYLNHLRPPPTHFPVMVVLPLAAVSLLLSIGNVWMLACELVALVIPCRNCFPRRVVCFALLPSSTPTETIRGS